MNDRPEARTARRLVGGVGPRIPVLTVDSGRPGPVAAVGGNLHGDECTGLGAVHALLDALPHSLRSGKVHLYPSLNPAGLQQGVRRLPGDALDPNRAFPGSSRGSRAERHAARVWGEIVSRRPDLYIDLHTDTAGALPYAIVDRVVRGPGGRALVDRCRVLAAASGLTVLGEYPPDRYIRFELDRSLPGALVNGPGIAALTLEVGPRRWVSPDAVALTTGAVLSVLTELGMLDQPMPPHESRRTGGPWRRESGPRAGHSGVLVPTRRPGETVLLGDSIAEIRTLEGDVREVLRAAEAGFVVAQPETAFVDVGTACATLAVRDLS
jgi:uncharacterized protein